MSTATQTKIWTYADLEKFADDESGNRYEIIDGRLVVTPSAIPLYEHVTMELIDRFNAVIRPGRLGRLYGARVDLLLPGGEVPIPDLFYIARDRLHIVGPKAIKGPPDIVVEILSPSTRGRDHGRKKDLYEGFGLREYWIADPVARTLTIFVLRDGRYEPLPEEDGVVRSAVLPGLAIDVAELFAAAQV